MSRALAAEPGAPTPREAATPLEAPITASRWERKYLLAPQQVACWTRLFDQRLTRHYGGRAAVTSGTQYQTSVYFDTKDRSIFHAARRDETVVQVRLREYHGRLDVTAPSTEALWLELKTKRGARVDKRRVSLSRGADLALLVGLGLGWLPGHRSLRCHLERAGGDAWQDRLSSLAQPVYPDSAVNYRREAWQSWDASLRVTLDHDVAFFAPQPGALYRAGGLRRTALGFARSRLSGCVLEVKSLGPCPGWLEAALEHHGLQALALSKFLLSSTAVRAGALGCCPLVAA